jgi:hypothetical protein
MPSGPALGRRVLDLGLGEQPPGQARMPFQGELDPGDLDQIYADTDGGQTISSPVRSLA